MHRNVNVVAFAILSTVVLTGGCPPMDPNAGMDIPATTTLRLINNSERPFRLALTVDDSAMEIAADAGVTINQGLECPDKLTLEELRFEVDGVAFSQSLDGVEARELLKDTNFACGDVIVVMVGVEVTEVRSEPQPDPQ